MSSEAGSSEAGSSEAGQEPTPAPVERFPGFVTSAEEAYLQGAGPAPVTAAGRLPARAAILFPGPASGEIIPGTRARRLFVDAEGAVVWRSDTGEARVAVQPGSVTGCFWVVDAGTVGARVPRKTPGWLVLGGARGPLFSTELSSWGPRGVHGGSDTARPDNLDADEVRTLGAEAFALALGCELEVLASMEDATERLIKPVPGTRMWGPPRPRRPADFLRRLAYGYGAAVVLDLVLAVVAPALCLPLVGAVLLVTTYPDIKAWRVRTRRVRTLPTELDWWWAADARGRGLGSRSVRYGDAGPAFEEFVVADGCGSEFWMAGPAAGGAASLVIAGEQGRPWGLLLYDRDGHLLNAMRTDEWLRDTGTEAVERLRAAVTPHGLVVSEADIPPIKLSRSRVTSRSYPGSDDTLASFITIYPVPLLILLALEPIALLGGHPGLAGAWAAVLVGGFGGLRLALSRRRVT